MKRNRLTKLSIDEVSLVDVPANPHAKVMVWKRDDQMPRTSDPLAAKKGRMRASLQKALENVDNEDVVDSALDDLIAEASTRDMEENPVTVEPNKLEQDLPIKPVDDVAKLEAANAALLARLSELEARVSKADDIAKRLVDAETALAKAAADKRVAERAAVLAKANVLDAQACAEVLDRLPTEDADFVAKRLIADAERIHKGALFAKLGSSRSDVPDNTDPIDVRARELVSKSGAGMTYEQAYASILKTSPDLRRSALRGDN